MKKQTKNHVEDKEIEEKFEQDEKLFKIKMEEQER